MPSKSKHTFHGTSPRHQSVYMSVFHFQLPLKCRQMLAMLEQQLFLQDNPSESRFCMLKQGSAGASLFVEQPIRTPAPQTGNRAQRRRRNPVSSETTLITICCNIIMEFLPNDTRKIVAYPCFNTKMLSSVYFGKQNASTWLLLFEQHCCCCSPLQRQRPASAINSETEGSKDKLGPTQGQGDSTLSLTAEEVRQRQFVT